MKRTGIFSKNEIDELFEEIKVHTDEVVVAFIC